MTAAARRPDTPTGIVIRFDVGKAGRYVSAECQLDAHWACPGGIREVSGAVVLVCLCMEPLCACARHLSGG
ncbi:hypothetical protein F7Q99_19715 [Streptomyces kaniharaensis]|uniref:Uncharacterized protein n=1 Tax=Streptomyces kaniharaensis TaxID=212423 RepID=A0A6N7KVT3_9ACTN|nr:hypothetical protein [Streptomyces kaniharaensis]MQS14427.1 hypothetical protein [Streptomyces kaniharaensis]